jgi:hypothetical protein
MGVRRPAADLSPARGPTLLLQRWIDNGITAGATT